MSLDKKMKTSICTSRVARPAEDESQRYTFRVEHEQNPMACLLDLFPGGFEVEFWEGYLAKVCVHDDFTATDELIYAIADEDGEIPPAIYWAWVDFAAVCVCWEWIEPLREAVPSDISEERAGVAA